MHIFGFMFFRSCLIVLIFSFTGQLKGFDFADLDEILSEVLMRHPNEIQAKDFWTYAQKHKKDPGTFSIQTIKFLENQEKADNMLQDSAQIIFQYSKNSWSKMQANVNYRKATFVIASTANCLEGAMNHGGMQALCSSHAVQGEEAVLSTPWSGYQRMTDKKYDLLKHKTILFDEFSKTGVYNNLKVGIHFNVPVLGYLTQPLHEERAFATVPLILTSEPSAQLIHQIFVSAVNIKTLARDQSMPDAQTDISYMIRGAILAVNYGKQLGLKAPPSDIIFIPFLGAGAFGNDWRWTIDALEDCAALIKALKLTVILNDFSSSLNSEKYNYLKGRAGLKGISISSRKG
jgi:hypothetical protein